MQRQVVQECSLRLISLSATCRRLPELLAMALAAPSVSPVNILPRRHRISATTPQTSIEKHAGCQPGTDGDPGREQSSAICGPLFLALPLPRAYCIE